jgi:hypothetical protein
MEPLDSRNIGCLLATETLRNRDVRLGAGVVHGGRKAGNGEGQASCQGLASDAVGLEGGMGNAIFSI